MKKRLMAVAALVTVSGSALSQNAPRTLTPYTSEVQANVQQHIDLFKSQNAGVDVRLFRSGTGEVTAKLEAEFSATTRRRICCGSRIRRTFKDYRKKTASSGSRRPSAARAPRTPTRAVNTLVQRDCDQHQ